MKRRIRELAAILLTVCMVLGSVGIESRANYEGVPNGVINTENKSTEAGWQHYYNATWINKGYSYTHYGWCGSFLSIPDSYKVYSVNDIVTDEMGVKQDPSVEEGMFKSVWTSTDAYRIPATETVGSYTISYKVNGNEATSTGYIDVSDESSISLKGEYYKAIGFMGGSDETYKIDNLANVRPTGVVDNIGTYDLQPDIRRYVTASYEMGAGTGVADAEFAAEANGNLTLSTLTSGKGTAPEGYTLDHWEYYIGDSKITTDSINLSSTEYSNTKAITCKAFWKPDSGHDIRFWNNSGMDISLKINENSTQEIKAYDTEPLSLYGVSSLSGWSTDGLYQITSWYGYADNSVSFTNNDAVLNLTSSTADNIQAVLNAVSYDEVSHLPIMNGYISPGSNALQRAFTLSFDSNAGVESGQIVNITDNGLDLSDFLPADDPYRDGLTFDRWTYFLTDSNTKGKADQEIQDGKLTLDNVSDYKTVRITPVYTGKVRFVDESGILSKSGYSEKMIQDEGTSIKLHDLSGLRDGYTFVGWSETNGSTTAEYAPGSSYTIVKNTTLYAVWKINTYNLTWQDYPDEEASYEPKTYSSKSVEYGSSIALPSDPQKEGYTFLGWNGYGSVYWGGDMSVRYKNGDKFSYTMPAQNAEMSAYWEINSYKLNYDGNGTSTGVPTESEEIVYKNTATVSSIEPIRAGYTFSGWSDGTNTYQPGATFSMPARNVTLTAQWKPNRHNVTYDGDGATSGVPDSHEADYDSSVTAGSGPKKDGYVFSGWEQISTGKTISAGGAFLMPDMDETLKAKWQIAYSKMGKGTFYLVKGQNYSMGGTLKVSGDTSVYSSGISFYVPSSGNYTFE